MSVTEPLFRISRGMSLCAAVLLVTVMGTTVNAVESNEPEVKPVAAATSPAQSGTSLSGHRLFDSSDTALIANKRFQVGVFSPLRWRWDERREFISHPLAFLLSPNVAYKQQVWSQGDFSVAVRPGLSVPTGLMRVLQGQLWGMKDSIGWMVSLDLGAIATWRSPRWPLLVSMQLRERIALTLVGETTIGHNDVPLLEDQFSHVTDGPTTVLGFDVDWYPHDRFALYVDFEVQWAPSAGSFAVDSNIDLRGKFMVAWAWTEGFSSSLGAMWVSSQLDRQRLSGVLPVPSTGLPMPLLDCTWRW